MMTTIAATTYVVKTFLKGVNQAVTEDLIDIDEAIKAENVNIATGALRPAYNNSDYCAATLNKEISCLMKYYHATTGYILAVANGGIYKLDKGTNTWSTVGTGYTSNNFDYINYQSGTTELMIYGNGSDSMKVYDGSKVRDLLNRRPIYNDKKVLTGYKDADEKDVALNGTISTKAPKGKFIELHKERVWIAGDSSYPNTLYFSTPMDADDWTTPTTEEEYNQHGGEFELPSWDGGQIIGIRSLFDDLIVFKTNNIYKVFGYDADTFSTSIVFDSIDGQIIDKSIASVHNKVFWLNTKGIYSFDGTNVVCLSDKIKDYFKTINQSCISKAVGITFGNKYILAVPTGSNTENNMIIEYNYLEDNFIVRTSNPVTFFTEFNDTLLCVNSIGKVYIYDNGTVPLSGAVWESGLNSLGYLNTIKNLNNFYFVGSGTGTIRVYAMTERNRYTKYKDVTLSSTEKVYNVKLKNKGRLIGIKIEGIGTPNFVIKQPTLFFDLDYD